jgi:hypothetical protein
MKLENVTARCHTFGGVLIKLDTRNVPQYSKYTYSALSITGFIPFLQEADSVYTFKRHPIFHSKNLGFARCRPGSWTLFYGASPRRKLGLICAPGVLLCSTISIETSGLRLVLWSIGSEENWPEKLEVSPDHTATYLNRRYQACGSSKGDKECRLPLQSG